MNTIWSRLIQGTNTLYSSRKLRFHDRFRSQYMPLFALDNTTPLRILEIGCGPGALAAALLRWYPNARITAIDRDSAFIEFARANCKGIEFMEGDATALPFANETFDVTISNTVAEHIEPEAFYREQMRVLRPNGVCLVLSARRGITAEPPCVAPGEFEQAFWQKAEQIDHRIEDHNVCQYPMTETELPTAMARYGFTHITTGYAAASLTPDDSDVPRELALEMIVSNRLSDLDSIHNVAHAFPDHFSPDEIEKMLQLTNEKYHVRTAQYLNGDKQWDTSTSITMVVRGMK